MHASCTATSQAWKETKVTFSSQQNRITTYTSLWVKPLLYSEKGGWIESLWNSVVKLYPALPHTAPTNGTPVSMHHLMIERASLHINIVLIAISPDKSAHLQIHWLIIKTSDRIISIRRPSYSRLIYTVENLPFQFVLARRHQSSFVALIEHYFHKRLFTGYQSI